MLLTVISYASLQLVIELDKLGSKVGTHDSESVCTLTVN